jgi:hypothetical protein
MKAKTKQNKKEYYSMKKLVVMAAALVAAASSYAQCAPGPDPVEAGPCAQVYTLEISIKTTIAKSGSLTIDNGDCAPAGITGVCYRVISSKSYKGYYWNCECGCELFQDNVLDLYNKKTDLPEVITGTIDWDLIQKIGKKNTEIEAAFGIEGATAEFYLMGFGKFDTKNDRVSSISGNVQAFLIPPYCTVDCAPGTFAPAYDLCAPILIPNMNETIGYGSFSMKYDSSKSKKLAANANYIDSLLPYDFAD